MDMKSDDEKVKEIMSSRNEFLNSVDSVVFIFRKIVSDSGHVNYLNFGNFEAENDNELRYFYDEYKTRGYDNFEIKIANRMDYMGRNYRYRVEMCKKYDGYTLYVVMILGVKE